VRSFSATRKVRQDGRLPNYFGHKTTAGRYVQETFLRYVYNYINSVHVSLTRLLRVSVIICQQARVVAIAGEKIRSLSVLKSGLSFLAVSVKLRADLHLTLNSFLGSHKSTSQTAPSTVSIQIMTVSNSRIRHRETTLYEQHP